MIVPVGIHGEIVAQGLQLGEGIDDVQPGRRPHGTGRPPASETRRTGLPQRGRQRPRQPVAVEDRHGRHHEEIDRIAAAPPELGNAIQRRLEPLEVFRIGGLAAAVIDEVVLMIGIGPIEEQQPVRPSRDIGRGGLCHHVVSEIAFDATESDDRVDTIRNPTVDLIEIQGWASTVLNCTRPGLKRPVMKGDQIFCALQPHKVERRQKRQ